MLANLDRRLIKLKAKHLEVLVDKLAIRKKCKARKLALQALYQWHMSGTALHEIEVQFRIVNNMEKVDGDYFRTLLYGIPDNLMAIQTEFTPFIDRTVESLNPIELTVLRIGTYELVNCIEIPYRVVLDEAIGLTKSFGSQDGHRYVNGVLNGVAHQVRKLEIENDIV